MKFLVAICVTVALLVTQTESVAKFLKKKTKLERLSDPAPFKTGWITQYVNHFSFNDDRTFQQRYLYNGN